ncbi:O-antigen ligase family protein [Solitalea sp. MAHUQ-68]|uniref:O-antigen ligase family protein n=1 Tax=Solitalea agri TaxID=2953739 RepID=A0A9X2JFP4_9SPHI|nr:O-antigen ligase family protein [Solitalea agri]MCO4293651.1 O-antigen ligase family protein [Solitalea agri]
MISTSFRTFLFAFFFMLVLKSGYLKWIPIWVLDPLYVGFLGLGLLYFISPKTIPISKNIQQILIILGALLTWIIFSCIYTSSPEIFKHKLLKTVLVFILFFIPFLFIRTKNDIKYFISIYNAYALIGALLVIRAFVMHKMEMFTIIGKQEETAVPNYLFLSIFLCSALILNLPKNKLPDILFKLLLFISMVVLGARSPILFGTLMIVVYYSLKYIVNVQKLVLFYGVLIGIGAVFLSWEGSERLIERFGSITSVRGNKSFDTRVSYQSKSVDLILERPVFGTGFGSFAREMTGEDIIDTPHNLFLEIGFETGIPGMILLIIFFVYLFNYMIKMIRKVRQQEDKELLLRYGLIITYFFLTAFVSLYLSNSKDIFALSGCFLAICNALIFEETRNKKSEPIYIVDHKMVREV